MNALRSLLLLPLLAAPALAAPPIVITGATVYPEPGKKLEGASVLIADGVIVAVGQLSPPANALVIDGRGKVVTAGFIDAFTTLGLNEVALEPTANDGWLESAEGVHAAYRVGDGYNASATAIPVTRTGGVTSVLAVPRGGVLSGTSAWMALDDAGSAVREIAAMHAWLGDAALGAAGGSRGKLIERLRELLDDAKTYASRKGAYEKNQTRRFAASRLDLEALGAVVDKRVPLMVWAQRASDIQAALRVAKELGLRLIIAGGAEAWRVAPALAQAKVPVLLDSTENLPGSFESLLVREDAAKLLIAAGVRVALSTLGEAANVRNLRQRAGIAVALGLTWEQALAAVTTVPATLLPPAKGERARGILAAKAAADVVLWSGDPFELTSRVERIFVGGVEQPLRTRQTLLLERYRKLPGLTRRP